MRPARASSHIWFTIAAPGVYHLKEIVLRIYWDGNPKPSVKVPVGDFFGLNLGQYNVYQSAFLNCSSVKALNCYFAMPFRKSARITVTNEGEQNVGSFYSNIDYQVVRSLPARCLYFHPKYRQATAKHRRSLFAALCPKCCIRTRPPPHPAYNHVCCESADVNGVCDTEDL
jgi:hypothetical protein